MASNMAIFGIISLDFWGVQKVEVMISSDLCRRFWPSIFDYEKCRIYIEMKEAEVIYMNL